MIKNNNKKKSIYVICYYMLNDFIPKKYTAISVYVYLLFTYVLHT